MAIRYLIAVGSNLGDRHQFIESAIEQLQQKNVRILKVSSFLETDPVGAADKMFLNAAFGCESDLEPHDFLKQLLSIEIQLGRQREKKWGNREIDLDILLAVDSNNQQIEMDTKDLQIPHPMMWKRSFVMKPASEVWAFTLRDLLATKSLTDRVLSDPSVYVILVAGLLLRFFFAASIPFGNDEAYYWDWGRNLQMSYFDHPPFVSWISRAGQMLVPASWTYLSGRLLVPIFHFLSCIFLLGIAENIKNRTLTSKETRAFHIITQTIPAFSLGGMMLMPDIGLILFSTLALWLMTSYIKLPNLGLRQGLLLGLVFGLAGLNKYHAFVIACGALIFLLVHRRYSLKSDLVFWISLLVAGLATVSPVFIWNAQHQWVSFLFQGQRGVTGDGLRVLPAVQTLIGEILFLGPIGAIGIYMILVGLRKNNGSSNLLLAASLPLLVILKIFSFSSQTLPHWTIPAFWVLSPLMIFKIGENNTSDLISKMNLAANSNWNPIFYLKIVFHKFNFIMQKIQRAFSNSRSIPTKFGLAYSILVCIIFPLVLSIEFSRDKLISLLNNQPGGLGEMTIWNAAERDRQFLDLAFSKNTNELISNSPSCPTVDFIAGVRWFTAAQLAANLPNHPMILNLDRDHLSYYKFRDSDLIISGCPITIISEMSHINSAKEALNLITSQNLDIVIEGHSDRPIGVVRGYAK
ncbi:MAG: 2-amino-4-hydroxy-6-hydroxymethyldihydropteridine diphosphokinase [Proteobacteria bacterium]|nr:2-amino-4-hydroxy-6-hydroxymethyldihydropteridine diphosphokinase [Pseudomonadota bacterium]